MSGPISSIIGGGQPIGSIVQAPYNLTDSAYLPCDGRKVLRATYPRLSDCLPSIGTFTATSRTKGATPTSSAIANNGTLWVVTGAVGTSNLHSTTDGITYTPRTTPATCDIRSVLHDGTNFVAANAVAGAMQYSANGTAWSTSATATVAAPGSTALQTCMTWASSLGTVGRFCLGAGATAAGTVYTSDDRGVTWTARTSGLAAINVFHVCWTGQKYIATSSTANTIYTSTDGITWVAQAMPFATAAATAGFGSIISDGNGKVLWVGAVNTGNSLVVSLDHGATWSIKILYDATGAVIPFAAATNSVANYTNGRFIVLGAASQLSVISTDLVGWTVSGDFALGNTGTVSHKSGVYLQNVTFNSTAASTLTEDATYMRLPYTVPSGAQGNKTDFIKVQ
jgi:hypothetical protein